MGLSVIVPVAEGDDSWKSLVSGLDSLTKDDELILCSKKSLKEQLILEAQKSGLVCGVHWAPSAIGRARQLNTGARWAKFEFLWFLHCDSKVEKLAINKLRASLENSPEAVHYFKLKFLKDGPWMTAANGVGVWFRSRLLRLPFGDQGFCMHRDVYRELGGFCEKASYGEDHLFVWMVHRRGVKLHCVNAILYTSARRYRSNGWLRTTSRHVILTVRQAAPELLQMLKDRVNL